MSNMTDQSKLPEIDSVAGLNSLKIMKTTVVWNEERMDFLEIDETQHYLTRH